MSERKKGSRANSGRKPSADPKQQVCLYIRRSDIEAMGDKSAVQHYATEMIEKKARLLNKRGL